MDKALNTTPMQQDPEESETLLRMAHKTLSTDPKYQDQIEMAVACKHGADAIDRLRKVICRLCFESGYGCRCEL